MFGEFGRIRRTTQVLEGSAPGRLHYDANVDTGKVQVTTDYGQVKEKVGVEEVENPAPESEYRYLWEDPEFLKEIYGTDYGVEKESDSKVENALGEMNSVERDAVGAEYDEAIHVENNLKDNVVKVTEGSDEPENGVTPDGPQTIEEKVREISAQILKYYHSYDYLSAANKARIFKFRIDDNKYNVDLHGMVLKNLGIDFMGADRFDDYQEIYEETLKQSENHGLYSAWGKVTKEFFNF